MIRRSSTPSSRIIPPSPARSADTGEIRTIARKGEYEHDENGRPVRMVGVVLDITERRAVQRALEESEAQFRTFAHEIALQIAAASPQYIKETDIPADVLEHETEIAKARARDEGKPENILDRIVEGQLKKFKDEFVLLRQAYIRDEQITVEKLLLQNVAAIGENVVIRRFQRWELGESTAAE
ncbi:MAG: hypothetical protein COY47_04475 [Chloroflexi bacterium CG_4_10_14_0_8_um_filter_57_5]|nr:MAG: hypothetical protein COY47_04475 [Chloroflexi bacterium CG_4_10_14_0_8_um_filter_57_5]